ncbi:hypothetical protein OROHE_006921 [Orobanche hederae]
MEVFGNSPFFITAEDAGTFAPRKNDDYKEISVSAGETYECIFDSGISEFIYCLGFLTSPGKNVSGHWIQCRVHRKIWEKNSDQDILRYKVDCIPPVVEPVPAAGQ